MSIFFITSLGLALKADVSTFEVDEIWAANTVNFDLVTQGDRQFIAYYDAERMMTVASRRLDSMEWTKQTLPSRLEFDSHNYVVLGFDEKGHIHVSGNMHNVPLVYFRSERPWDVSSLVQVKNMVSREEERVTYPAFFNTQRGYLLYSYRIGGSGNGNILVNRYDVETQTWERYLDEPLFAGIAGDETRSAYHAYLQDSAGNLHFSWIWRWTPAVETSHNICYAMTPDMKHWQNAAGEPVSLPFKPDDPAVIVDPVPSKGGSHNGRVKLILDQDNEPVMAYVKYDEEGLTQLYLARFEAGVWQSKQISDWDFRWEFHGGGDGMTIGGSFQLVGLSPENFIVIDWQTEKGDSGQYVVDAKTLALTDQAHTLQPPLPAGASDRITDLPDLQVNLHPDSGTASNGKRYVLKWEAGKRAHRFRGEGEEPAGPVTKLYLIEF